MQESYDNVGERDSLVPKRSPNIPPNPNLARTRRRSLAPSVPKTQDPKLPLPETSFTREKLFASLFANISKCFDFVLSGSSRLVRFAAGMVPRGAHLRRGGPFEDIDFWLGGVDFYEFSGSHF